MKSPCNLQPIKYETEDLLENENKSFVCFWKFVLSPSSLVNEERTNEIKWSSSSIRSQVEQHEKQSACVQVKDDSSNLYERQNEK